MNQDQTPTADELPDIIFGNRPVLKRRHRWAIAVAGVGSLLLVTVWDARPNWTLAGIIAISLPVRVVNQLRPPTVITAAGIDRPWCRRSFLTWDSIDHVVEQSYVSDVRVTTTEGKTLRLFGVDASLTADVAALSARPVRPHQIPTPRTVTKEPTQREMEADVARRAAALADERRRMSDSDKQRRPGP
jgi:hypothetical protein